MKRLICLAALALALVGCGSVAPGVTVTEVYVPPFFQRLGVVNRVEDADRGVTFYYLVQSDGDLLIGTFLSGDSKLRSMTESAGK